MSQSLQRQIAVERAQRIRDLGNDFAKEIVAAYNEKDYLALGYSSWSEYCHMEHDGRIALPRIKGDRMELVKSLSDSGLSQRAIADATNMSRNTIAKYLNPPVAQIDPHSFSKEEVEQARNLTDEIQGEKNRLSQVDPLFGDVFNVLKDPWVIRAIQLESLTPVEVFESYLRKESPSSERTDEEYGIDLLLTGLLTRTGRWIKAFNPDVPLSNHFTQEV